MERVYFFSDVHLSGHRGDVEARKINNLLAFLDWLKDRTDVLYIVGDLFDFWFEYKSAIPKTSLRLLSRLCQLSESGVTIRYFTGNHDLWQDGYLAHEVGLELYRGPSAVQHNSLRLFIAHGDGVLPGDWKAKVRDAIFRNRLNIRLYRFLHPDVGIPLASLVARKSRENEGDPREQQYREYAKRKLNEGFDAVILGHTHLPALEEFDSKYYINLGDWITRFTYLELEGKRFRLESWSGT
ncbi:MAG: UDP-2,3-diacylglucosamine diphosphatase [Calditrichaeota bacterium]|nr:MAG: UDP-2,3-diacylglucosamine diphosphatase [Calditrichota bacterium]